MYIYIYIYMWHASTYTILRLYFLMRLDGQRLRGRPEGHGNAKRAEGLHEAGHRLLSDVSMILSLLT